MIRALVLLALTAPFAACAPISVEQAETACVEDANLAKRPRGRIGLGVGAGGRATGMLDVTISSDYLTGRDPSAVFNACVKSRSGQFPSRPLTDQPGWIG